MKKNNEESNKKVKAVKKEKLDVSKRQKKFLINKTQIFINRELVQGVRNALGEFKKSNRLLIEDILKEKMKK